MAEKDKLLTSAYDGIQEYDNDLPQWWVWLFVLTIVFAGAYSVYYYSGAGPTQEEYLAADLKSIEALRPKSASAPSGDLLALVSDSAVLEKGKGIYVARCAVCHVADGGGMIGPNLTDDYWLHGGTIEAVHTVIVEGVPEKGMMSWKNMIPPDEINAVTAYVWTLRGTTPAKAKEPQGELVPR